MVINGLLAVADKCLGACGLSGLLLWQVAGRAGTQTSEVVVHVTESPVVVTIDGRSYPVATWRDSPIACELPMGWHELRMRRGAQLVYQEAFLVRPGENVVLTARDPHPR
jgi:hypothetical protein